MRVGNVRQFHEVTVAHGQQFVADKTYTLIMRYAGTPAYRLCALDVT